MKNYVFFLFISILTFSQSSQKQTIEDRIKQIENLGGDDKTKAEKIISICNELYYISKKEDNKKGTLVAIMKLASTYLNKGENNECLKIIDEGLILAEELGKYDSYASLYYMRGKALTVAGNYPDARTNFSKSLKIADLIEDSDKKYSVKTMTYNFLVDYARLNNMKYQNIGYKDSILYFAKKGYEASLKLSKKFKKANSFVGQSARVLGSAYVNHGNFIQGRHYYNIAEKRLINNPNKMALAALYIDLGEVAFAQGNDKEAFTYYEKVLELTKNLHYVMYTEATYNFFIKYYKKNGDIKQELYYMEKSKKLNDSIHNINQSALIMQNHNEMISIQKKSESSKMIWIILLVVSIVITVFFIVIYFKQKKKSISLLLNKDKYESSLSQTKLINEERVALLLEMAKYNDKQFFITFQEEFEELYQELLKFSELTSTDIEFCAYLKLNIQTKEIAIYKKLSIGAVDNRKYRIRKKLNLLPETDLYKWINSINSKTKSS